MSLLARKLKCIQTMIEMNLKLIQKRFGNNMNETETDLDCIICII